jgi:uncharacterized membrane protein
MGVMIAGLVLFIGIHLVPTAPSLRAHLALKLGANAYRGIFSLIAALGLLLIIAGYWMRPERVQLFAPWPAARAAAPWLVTIAFVLFAAANMKTHVRKALRHPMLIGLALWSGVHLLANGDMTGTILFGSFLAYAAVDLLSAAKRYAVVPFEAAWKYDAMAIAGGLVAAYLTIRFHPAVFGTGPVA